MKEKVKKEKAVAKPKKVPAKKAAITDVDFNNIIVSGRELSDFVGLVAQNISSLSKTGTFIQRPDGNYNLKENVLSYCKRIRKLRAGDNKKTDSVTEELNLWKIEKAKQGIKSWRMNRDREVTSAVILKMQTALTALKAELQYVPKIGEAIDAVISDLDRIDPSEISYIVEGSDDDEEED